MTAITPYAYRPDHRSLTRRSRGPVEPAGYPTPITITMFGAGDDESVITGWVWSMATPISGHRSAWVIYRSPITNRLPIAVVITGKRHQVGRTDQHGVWRPGRGRYVDAGEIYTETHASSPSGRRTHLAGAYPSPRRSIRTFGLPQAVYDLLSTPPK